MIKMRLLYQTFFCLSRVFLLSLNFSFQSHPTFISKSDELLFYSVVFQIHSLTTPIIIPKTLSCVKGQNKKSVILFRLILFFIFPSSIVGMKISHKTCRHTVRLLVVCSPNSLSLCYMT